MKYIITLLAVTSFLSAAVAETKKKKDSAPAATPVSAPAAAKKDVEKASCGMTVTAVTNGEKVVGIQLTGADKKTSTAEDDDGFLTIALVASHCRNEVKPAKIELTEKQKACIDKVQQEKITDEKARINFEVDSSEENAKTVAKWAIRKACDNLDYQSMWRSVRKNHGVAKITCGKNVTEILNKAVKKNEAYVAEMTDPAKLATLDGTASAKEKFAADLKADLVYSKEFQKILANESATVADLEAWFEALENPVVRHGYLVSKEEEGKTKQAHRHLKDILSDIGAEFRFLAKKDSCSPKFESNVATALAKIEWKAPVAATTPAATTAPSERAGK
jgi:hypothetical protein